jgi:hypothetical protein
MHYFVIPGDSIGAFPDLHVKNGRLREVDGSGAHDETGKGKVICWRWRCRGCLGGVM